MKRYFYAALLFIFVMMLSGCAEGGTGNLSRLFEGQPTIPQRPQTAEPFDSEIAPVPREVAPRTEAGHVDIDLTRMSVTMVSAQVWQMMVIPYDYLGLTVRVRGSYYTFLWDEADMQLHYVVLDLTAGCCGQAIEFILSEELINSIGYPVQNTPIEITGVFTYYEKFGYLFFYLAVDEIVFL